MINRTQIRNTMVGRSSPKPAPQMQQAPQPSARPPVQTPLRRAVSMGHSGQHGTLGGMVNRAMGAAGQVAKPSHARRKPGY